jgi:hypothetical protein
MKCDSCGGVLQPQELTCRFCGTATPRAFELERAKDRARDTQNVAAARENAATAKRALRWALGGFVFLVLPVPGIVAIVLALRARERARAVALPPPENATLSIVLGIVQLVAFGGIIAFAVYDSNARAEKASALRAAIADRVKRAELDVDTACSLVHLHLLEHGAIEGRASSAPTTSVDAFECQGKLEQAGERATLEDVRFRSGAYPFVTRTACLKRGRAWMVSALIDGPTCP